MNSHTMKSLAVMNQKGGVGKTTVSTHVAVTGVRLGLVTLILDLDPQPNATLWADDRHGGRGGPVQLHLDRLAPHLLKSLLVDLYTPSGGGGT